MTNNFYHPFGWNSPTDHEAINDIIVDDHYLGRPGPYDSETGAYISGRVFTGSSVSITPQTSQGYNHSFPRVSVIPEVAFIDCIIDIPRNCGTVIFANCVFTSCSILVTPDTTGVLFVDSTIKENTELEIRGVSNDTPFSSKTVEASFHPTPEDRENPPATNYYHDIGVGLMRTKVSDSRIESRARGYCPIGVCELLVENSEVNHTILLQLPPSIAANALEAIATIDEAAEDSDYYERYSVTTDLSIFYNDTAYLMRAVSTLFSCSAIYMDNYTRITDQRATSLSQAWKFESSRMIDVEFCSLTPTVGISLLLECSLLHCSVEKGKNLHINTAEIVTFDRFQMEDSQLSGDFCTPSYFRQSEFRDVVFSIDPSLGHQRRIDFDFTNIFIRCRNDYQEISKGSPYLLTPMVGFLPKETIDDINLPQVSWWVLPVLQRGGDIPVDDENFSYIAGIALSSNRGSWGAIIPAEANDSKISIDGEDVDARYGYFRVRGAGNYEKKENAEWSHEQEIAFLRKRFAELRAESASIRTKGDPKCPLLIGTLAQEPLHQTGDEEIVGLHGDPESWVYGAVGSRMVAKEILKDLTSPDPIAAFDPHRLTFYDQPRITNEALWESRIRVENNSVLEGAVKAGGDKAVIRALLAGKIRLAFHEMQQAVHTMKTHHQYHVQPAVEELKDETTDFEKLRDETSE